MPKLYQKEKTRKGREGLNHAPGCFREELFMKTGNSCMTII